MARLYKIEMYIVDYNDDYSTLEDIISDMELATDVFLNCFNVEEVNVKWNDDIDLNFANQSVEIYRKYFKE